MTAEHVLKNTSATLSMTFSSAPDAGVTVTITDAAGAAVVTDEATTVAGSTASYLLDPQAEVASLTAVWTGDFGGVEQSVSSAVEIVGGHLFTIAQARAFDDQALNNDTLYPDSLIRETRAGIAEMFATECGVSFVPMYGRETLSGERRRDLWLSNGHVNRILSANVDTVALTPTELADVQTYPYGRMFWSRSWAWGHRNIVVEYEHGYQTVPYEIHRAALVLARYTLVATNLSDRTISLSNELGTVRLSVPGHNYPTGIPVVDAALGRYSQVDIAL